MIPGPSLTLRPFTRARMSLGHFSCNGSWTQSQKGTPWDAAHGSRFEPELPDSSDDGGLGVSGAGAVLSVMAGRRSAKLCGRWLSGVFRRQKEEADTLTKACFERFGPARMAYLDPASIQWKVLGVELLAVAGVLGERVRL